MKTPSVILALALGLMPIAATANEALAKQRAALARFTFSQWHAMPLHNNFGADVGDLIDTRREAPVLSAAHCLPGLVRTDLIRGQTESFALTLDRAASAELAVDLGLDGLPADVKANVARTASTSAHTDVVRTGDFIAAGGSYAMEQAISDEDKCALIPAHLGAPNAGRMLVARVFMGTLKTKFEISAETKASIEAAAKAGAAPVDIAASAGASTKTAQAVATLRPYGSLAVQLSRMDPDAARYIYALKQEHPETWAELERLVDSYITGSEVSGLPYVGSKLREYWEKMGRSPTTVPELRQLLFASEKTRRVDDYAELELPDAVWEALSIYAAAVEIHTASLTAPAE